MKLFLDLDGVLSDFVGAACRAHAIPNPYLLKENFGEFNMAKACGFSNREFWKPMNEESFWSSMEPTEDFDHIMVTVLSFFDEKAICILTSPSASPSSASGKMKWVIKHLHSFRRRLIISPAKHFIAHENALLIDDHSKNCKAFRSEGGLSFLLPRPWNESHTRTTFAINDLHSYLALADREWEE